MYTFMEVELRQRKRMIGYLSLSEAGQEGSLYRRQP